MNLILFGQHDYTEGNTIIRLKDRRFQHIRNILKAKKGDRLRVGELNGLMGAGDVVGISDRFVDLSVHLKSKPPKPLAVTLILALPRPIVLKRILVSICSMGIKKIVLLHTNRVEKSYWASPVLKQENINEQLLRGLEQACDTILPQVLIRKRFKIFVEDELPSLIKKTQPLLAHPRCAEKRLNPTKKPTTLLIGPEGGLIPYELDQLKNKGFKSFCIGGRILKVETVIPFIISRIIS